MYMCDTCFQLITDKQDCCPIYHCTGHLVHIDEDIAWYISKINILLQQNNFLIKTTNCCSSHPNDTLDAYVEFGFLDENIPYETVNELTDYFDKFKNEIIKKPLKQLNDTLSDIGKFVIQVRSSKNLEISDYAFSICPEFNIFKSIVESKYEFNQKQIKVNSAFKLFLLNIIQNLKLSGNNGCNLS